MALYSTIQNVIMKTATMIELASGRDFCEITPSKFGESCCPLG